MYYRKKFWSRTKSHQNVPNLPPVIYFHAQVLQKEVLESHEIAPKCPKFAAGDLFPRACITERSFGVARNRTNFAAGDLFSCACICEFRWQFLLISLLRSRGSLRLPRSLRARIIIRFLVIFFNFLDFSLNLTLFVPF